MPGFKDRIKAFGKRIKPSTWTKPDHKGFVRAARKAFYWVLPCVKRRKDEDDCPGLPEVKISYAEEEIPELLASRSCISLTDSLSDAVADLSSNSDSLEGIPEMLEAERLPSLMENDEEKEAAGKGKDGEKDLGSHDACPAEAEINPGPTLDSLPQPQVTDVEEAIHETLVIESISSLMDKEAGLCPMEADPEPRSERVPEPQERPSDENCSDQQFDADEFNCSPTKEMLHLLCTMFPKLSKEEKWKYADMVGFIHLDMMLEHFLESEETACNQLMYTVLGSQKCNLDTCLNEFILKLNKHQMEDSEDLLLAKVKALRGIKAIVADLSNVPDLKHWLQYHLVTLANILVTQFQPKDQGTNGKFKTYLVPGEAIDVLAILLQRLDLVHNMKCTLCPV